MSILLDALKKSETQRQLGKTPDIHSTVESPNQKPGGEQQWLALSMLVLSAAAIGWFGWQQFRTPAGMPDGAGVDVIAMPEVQDRQSVENQSVVTAQVPAGKTKPETKKRTLPRSMWSKDVDVSGLTVLPPASPGDETQRMENLSRSFNSYEAEKDSAPVNKAATPSQPIAQASSNAATSQAAPAEPVAAEAKPAPRRSRSLQAHEVEPISFWQIPQALRDDLPEFRINVLVYAEKPQDRFLLINGQRLIEKEELINGVVLDEIRRDGAVFRYRNYRFLIKG
jgi:general secretion pathway protein B